MLLIFVLAALLFVGVGGFLRATRLHAVSIPGLFAGPRGARDAGAALVSESKSRKGLAAASKLASPRPPRPEMPSVSVVVPALNEEQSIGWVIENIPDWVDEVVLVDGLSVDGTELVVTDQREDVVIVHQRNRGKGAALRAGFAAASGDIIVMIDADGSTDPREMGRYVEALKAGADFAKGSRNLKGGGSVDFTLLRHLGNLGFVYAANLLFRVRFSDLCYGYCAFWREDLDRLALTAGGFEIEMELILSAVKTGMNIAEVPSMELERRAGESNLNAWKDGKRVLKTLVKERMRHPDSAPAVGAKISLAMVELPAHDTRQWRPAGTDRRRYDDRRGDGDERAAYAGPERRGAPDRRVRVLLASDGSEDRVVSYDRRSVAR